MLFVMRALRRGVCQASFAAEARDRAEIPGTRKTARGLAHVPRVGLTATTFRGHKQRNQPKRPHQIQSTRGVWQIDISPEAVRCTISI